MKQCSLSRLLLCTRSTFYANTASLHLLHQMLLSRKFFRALDSTHVATSQMFTALKTRELVLLQQRKLLWAAIIQEKSWTSQGCHFSTADFHTALDARLELRDTLARAFTEST